MLKRILCGLAAIGLIAGSTQMLTAQDAPKSIKVGYVISLSGPQAAGALLTTVPNYRLWIDEVNKAGGIMLKKYGKRIPIEVTEVDDRSNNEDMVRLVERLMTVDKMDIVLSPWGTGPNLQVLPVFNKYGYPHVMGTAATDRINDLAPKFDNAFWMLGRPTEGVKALVDMLNDLRKKGQIKDTVALFSVQHPFGAEFLAPAKAALAANNYKVVYETTYPLGSADLSAQIKAAKAANPDIMLAFSYPPDTFMLTEQALANDFNPKVMFLSVGAAFPSYRGKFGDKINGVFGLGAWDPTGPGVQDWVKRHQDVNKGQVPDRWASSNTYAGLQILQQAIERVGEIDNKKIIAEMKTGTFKTILGDVKLENNQLTKLWWVGQYQGGEYKGVAPANLPGAVAPQVK
ncbi:MAG: amino acid ABC transporter substrate-binding protein [Xanthobacteraceae bacterium]|nr:amino acid ABC transporter substrate-binding protein [Xanthobacteraceae bacterium]